MKSKRNHCVLLQKGGGRELAACTGGELCLGEVIPPCTAVSAWEMGWHRQTKVVFLLFGGSYSFFFYCCCCIVFLKFLSGCQALSELFLPHPQLSNCSFCGAQGWAFFYWVKSWWDLPTMKSTCGPTSYYFWYKSHNMSGKYLDISGTLIHIWWVIYILPTFSPYLGHLSFISFTFSSSRCPIITSTYCCSYFLLLGTVTFFFFLQGTGNLEMPSYCNIV